MADVREVADLLNRLNTIVRELVSENSQLKAEAEGKASRPKLSPGEVSSIRELYRAGLSQKAIADTYDVNPATVSRIVRGIYHAKGGS
ncbi:helix-turn-helix DNA-binding domain protein [Mycobacterium phage Archetta]|uniref:Helix-turn-helix DNA-binding domain protein n=3 Tax=Benedictvirus TaxID=2946819 RepID=A0A5Q2WES6_9CAUD|nr:HTH DNA binding protein [Mycobacterium phage Jovo]YP_010060920.1 HTH DNA binding protein [Mycobacterium phage Bluefalcon]YP_010061003.1 HTH DNA binding protein [Mycobacterium phage Archetta]ATW60013.1 helix-turn-helix DNA binding domain protein [Mycobacterium phage Phlorence]ATW60432.1 helix-turn-helix DNA-binding domain protein [Mycobacterium phage ForGetIt]ATW60985.1 helix-turn-helix DNA-binding domain protein [Mycobacterium phage Aragog]ATW61227.1 helix-turn-helix DNA-binding domain pro